MIETLEAHRIGPELRIQDFDDYIGLVNGDAQLEIEKYLEVEHEFEG